MGKCRGCGQRGIAATALAIGGLILLTVATIATSIVLRSQRQTQKSRAEEGGKKYVVYWAGGTIGFNEKDEILDYFNSLEDNDNYYFWITAEHARAGSKAEYFRVCGNTVPPSDKVKDFKEAISNSKKVINVLNNPYELVDNRFVFSTETDPPLNTGESVVLCDNFKPDRYTFFLRAYLGKGDNVVMVKQAYLTLNIPDGLEQYTDSEGFSGKTADLLLTKEDFERAVKALKEKEKGAGGGGSVKCPPGWERVPDWFCPNVDNEGKTQDPQLPSCGSCSDPASVANGTCCDEAGNCKSECYIESFTPDQCDPSKEDCTGKRTCSNNAEIAYVVCRAPSQDNQQPSQGGQQTQDTTPPNPPRGLKVERTIVSEREVLQFSWKWGGDNPGGVGSCKRYEDGTYAASRNKNLECKPNKDSASPFWWHIVAEKTDGNKIILFKCYNNRIKEYNPANSSYRRGGYGCGYATIFNVPLTLLEEVGNVRRVRIDLRARDAFGNITDIESPARRYYDILAQNQLSPTSATLTPPSGVENCPTKDNGDADCNGEVNGIDYVIWLKSQCSKNCPAYNLKRADFNFDGVVDDKDYGVWFDNRI